MWNRVGQTDDYGTRADGSYWANLLVWLVAQPTHPRKEVDVSFGKKASHEAGTARAVKSLERTIMVLVALVVCVLVIRALLADQAQAEKEGEQQGECSNAKITYGEDSFQAGLACD